MFLTLLQVTSSNWSDSERRTHGHQVRGPVAVYKFQKLWNKLETMIRDPDDISESILHQYHPAVLTEKYPAETTGDGNCFYRTVSRALTGTVCLYITECSLFWRFSVTPLSTTPITRSLSIWYRTTGLFLRHMYN